MPPPSGHVVAPELRFTDAEGREVVASAFRGEPALLVFVRHLGCLPCQEHLREIAARSGEIDARIACIAFARPARLPGFARRLALPFPVLTDPDRASYRAFGFERGSVRRVWLDRRVWRRYGQLLRRGRRLQSSEEDTLQLGGDVVLDPEGRVAWVHRSRGPEDRPGVDEIVRAVQGARQAARSSPEAGRHVRSPT